MFQNINLCFFNFFSFGLDFSTVIPSMIFLGSNLGWSPRGGELRNRRDTGLFSNEMIFFWEPNASNRDEQSFDLLFEYKGESSLSGLSKLLWSFHHDPDLFQSLIEGHGLDE